MPAADLLFTGAAVFTGTGEPIHGHAVAVTGGPHQRGRPRGRGRRARRRAHPRRSNSTARCSAPASRTRTCTRSAPASSCCMCNLTEATDAADAVANVDGLRRREPRRAVDPRRRLVDGPLPGRRPGRARCSTRSCPTGPCCSSAATTTARGRTPPRSGSPGSTPPRPTPPTAASSAKPTASRPAPSTRAPSTCSRDVRPQISDDLAYAGLLRAQEELLALGITGWQDAFVGGGLGGIQDVDAVLPARARRGHAARARRRRPVVGARRRPRAGRAR